MTTTEILKAGPQQRVGVVGATIITRRGHYFDFLDPKPDTIEIEDIAWGLANTCRFGGQSLEFYSVAQHSVMASFFIAPEGQRAADLRREALMHDAAEAYIGDIPKPLKQLLPDYKVVEERVETAIARKFAGTKTDQVKQIGNAVSVKKMKACVGAIMSDEADLEESREAAA